MGIILRFLLDYEKLANFFLKGRKFVSQICALLNTVPLPIDKCKFGFRTYYLFFKVITPASDALVLLCFHPDTVRQLTPL